MCQLTNIVNDTLAYIRLTFRKIKLHVCNFHETTTDERTNVMFFLARGTYRVGSNEGA